MDKTKKQTYDEATEKEAEINEKIRSKEHRDVKNPDRAIAKITKIGDYVAENHNEYVKFEGLLDTLQEKEIYIGLSDVEKLKEENERGNNMADLIGTKIKVEDVRSSDNVTRYEYVDERSKIGLFGSLNIALITVLLFVVLGGLWTLITPIFGYFSSILALISYVIPLGICVKEAKDSYVEHENIEKWKEIEKSLPPEF